MEAISSLYNLFVTHCGVYSHVCKCMFMFNHKHILNSGTLNLLSIILNTIIKNCTILNKNFILFPRLALTGTTKNLEDHRRLNNFFYNLPFILLFFTRGLMPSSSSSHSSTLSTDVKMIGLSKSDPYSKDLCINIQS